MHVKLTIKRKGFAPIEKTVEVDCETSEEALKKAELDFHNQYIANGGYAPFKSIAGAKYVSKLTIDAKVVELKDKEK